MVGASKCGRVPRLAVVAGVVIGFAGCSSGSDNQAVDDPSPRDDAPSETVPTDTGAADDAEPVSSRTAPVDPAGWTDPAGATVLFRDVTVDAGVDVRFESALVADLSKDTAIMMGGAAAADFDNDGDTDLFVLGGGVERDSLFVNDGTGRFDDRTAEAGLDEPHLGAGVAVGDYDADGFVDMFVTSHGTPESGPITGAHRLYRNNGDLTFTDVAVEAGVDTTGARVPDGFGAVFGDADLDGDLDLVVAGWQRDGFANRYFRNNGDGTFDDRTEAAGIVDEGIRGFSPCLVDTTGDRYPELLLVADFSTTEYFMNGGAEIDGDVGRFELAAAAIRDDLVTGGVNGMGTAVGDVNNDGLLDWYVTAIYDKDENGRGTGNKLYLNVGEGKFEEVAATAGVDDGSWGWGTTMVDVNHDGWLDIVATNGWDLPSYVGNPSTMWVSDGAGGFTDVAAEAGPIHELFGLSVVQFDLEGDGDQDLGFVASDDDFTLYRNDLTNGGDWLRVLLDTSSRSDIAPNGIGAMVRVRVGDDVFTRTVGGCANFNNTNELSAHFGLGPDAEIDEVVVEWANGEVTTLTAVESNQTITITPAS